MTEPVDHGVVGGGVIGAATPGPLARGTNTGPYYATDGVGPDLMTAARDAVRRMIVDALHHKGVRHIDMPATPKRVWEAMHAAG